MVTARAAIVTMRGRAAPVTGSVTVRSDQTTPTTEVGMTVLGWVAVLVGAWCVVSVLAALGLGALLRRGSLVDGELSDQGRARELLSDSALAMWLAEVPSVPDTPMTAADDLPRPRAPRDVGSGTSEVPTFR